MKILGLSIVVSVGLLAVSATVKYEDVNITINNGIAQSYKVDSNFTFNQNEKICLISTGRGQVHIVDSFGVEEALSKSNKCFTFKPKIATLSLSKGSLFKDTKEATRDGTGSKGSKDNKYTEDILLSEFEGVDYIKMTPNLKWTPQFELQILGKDTPTKKIAYKDGIFLVPVKFLKKGQNIKVIQTHMKTTLMDSEVR